MRKSMRFLALLLALALSLTFLAGCGSAPSATTGAPSNAGASAAPATAAAQGPAQKVVLYLVSFNKIPDSCTDVENAINQYISQKYPDAKVELELKIFGPAEYQDKINLAMQSGTQMDIFIPLGIQSFIAKNQCLPLEDLVKNYGKELTAKLDADIGGNYFAPLSKDGHIYGIPVNKGMVVTPTLTYDKDMLDKMGVSIDTINSIRDLEPVLAKVKEMYPDVYPFAGTNQQDSGILQILNGEKKVDPLSDMNTMMGVVIGGSGKVVNLYDSQEFKDYIGIIRDWFNKGYLPKDMATSTTRAQELLTSGRLFCTWAGYGGNSIGATISGQTGKNIGAKWIAPMYFTSASAGLGMCISSTSKVPEASMKMLNIIYTDEFVINTILYGVENVDYVKVDEHHWKYPDGKDLNSVPYTAALCTGVIGSESLQLQPVGVSYDDVVLKMKMNKEVERSPYFGFNFDSSKVINEMTALQNVYTQYMPGLICGSSDPATTIPEYVNALKAAGIDKVIAEKQSQLDAWLTANKK